MCVRVPAVQDLRAIAHGVRYTAVVLVPDGDDAAHPGRDAPGEVGELLVDGVDLAADLIERPHDQQKPHFGHFFVTVTCSSISGNAAGDSGETRLRSTARSPAE